MKIVFVITNVQKCKNIFRLFVSRHLVIITKIISKNIIFFVVISSFARKNVHWFRPIIVSGRFFNNFGTLSVIAINTAAEREVERDWNTFFSGSLLSIVSEFLIGEKYCHKTSQPKAFFSFWVQDNVGFWMRIKKRWLLVSVCLTIVVVNNGNPNISFQTKVIFFFYSFYCIASMLFNKFYKTSFVALKTISTKSSIWAAIRAVCSTKNSNYAGHQKRVGVSMFRAALPFKALYTAWKVIF